MIEWLDEFYGDPDLKATMLRNFLPVFSSYVAEATGGPVAASFVQALAESYVDRHLGSSRAQLQEVVKGADNPLADLQSRFDEWEEKRPGKVAANELVRSANAASVEKMREAGVTKMVWRASGAKTCPFCAELDGTVIEVTGTFFEAGDELNPEGATAPIHFESSLGHPPIHQGCVCSVEAVTNLGETPTEAPKAEVRGDPDYPLIELGKPWPTKGEPHPVTGWAEPANRVTLTSGVKAKVDSYGDAVPGGYNGGFVMFEEQSGAKIGFLEYQSGGSSDPVTIAMVEVSSDFRRSGASDALLMRLTNEFPGQKIDPGMMTADGVRWWNRVKKYVPHD